MRSISTLNLNMCACMHNVCSTISSTLSYAAPKDYTAGYVFFEYVDFIVLHVYTGLHYPCANE